MSKRLGKTDSYKVKELIFVLLLFIIALAIAALFLFRDIVQIWIVAGALTLILFFFVSKYDFLLTLKEYERAVIFRLGKVSRVGGPGWTLIFPVLESARIVDLRTHTIDIPKQDVITRDNVVVKIDAIIYLFVNKDVESVTNSVIEVKNYEHAAEQFVLSSIRDVVGELTLQELISSIDKLNKAVKERLQQITESWGVSIEAVEIQEVTLPKELSDAYAEQKAAEQKKLARMESAKAHSAEIDAVREAAEKLSDKAISYYYIQALEKLGQGASTKYLFPMELTDLASKIAGTKSQSSLENLFKQYEPQIKKYLADTQKEKRASSSRRRKRR